jgi:histidine triad (HIT) family protein
MQNTAGEKSMHGTPYEPDNIFAKILRGEIPCHAVYEDEHTLAFMDVMPQSNGHTLVIPKVPSRNLLDADPTTFMWLMPTVQKIAFHAHGIQVIQFNETPAGQTVFHLHFHVIPIYEGVALKHHNRSHEDGGHLAHNAELIREAMKFSS